MYQSLASLFLSIALLAPGPALAETPPQRLVAEAEELALAGDFDAALPLYEKAIAALSAEPGRQQALRYRYGMVLNALGARARPDLYPLARAQFQAVLTWLEGSDNPPQPFEHSPARVRAALAHTYHQQSASEENPAQRAHFLRTAYQLYSDATPDLAQQHDWHNLAITYFNLGQVCDWQGNLEEAIEWLEKAVALDREHGFTDLTEDTAYLLALRRQANPTASAATIDL